MWLAVFASLLLLLLLIVALAPASKTSNNNNNNNSHTVSVWHDFVETETSAGFPSVSNSNPVRHEHTAVSMHELSAIPG
jgi:hypothetical protein